MRRYRSISIAVFAVVFCALVGGFYGRSALAIEDQVPDQYKVFTAALNAIDGTYVGTVESDRLVYGAIAGMLQTLDPHSSFMDPRTYAQMRERQEGRYYGLGITIAVVDGEITVVSLFEGSPAYQKGLRRGDIMVVAPYNEQLKWLRDRLPAGVAVGTVDKFQGQEAPVVFFSMTTSSGADVPRNVEFLLSRNRLNVAISRACCLAYVVASPKLLEVGCRSIEQMRMANALCLFVDDAAA